MPQTFLETDEDRLLIARFDIDHAIGHESGLRESRGKKIRARKAPQNLSPRAGRDPRRKERRGGGVDRVIAAARHLVQGAKRQSASVYLKALASLGILCEIEAGREKIYTNPALLTLLSDRGATEDAS